jgi:phosphoglycolate phosphatase
VNTALTEVVAHTRTLLLDFDGPLCGIFAGYPAPTVADDLRRQLQTAGVDPTPAIAATNDPLQVLRLVADLRDDALTRRVADALRDVEVAAAATAEPTPHADWAIRAALDTGRSLAVVSNNSIQAVTAYLNRIELFPAFACVIARYDAMPPQLMKPHPHLIGLAFDSTGAAVESTALVGDTVSDIQAAGARSVRSIGYANKPGKAETLAHAGARAIITSMAELADALVATPIRP